MAPKLFSDADDPLSATQWQSSSSRAEAMQRVFGGWEGGGGVVGQGEGVNGLKVGGYGMMGEGVRVGGGKGGWRTGGRGGGLSQ